MTDSGNTVGDCDCFIGVSGQFSDVWQGFREGEDKHCNGVVNSDPDKTGDGVGDVSAKWCCNEGGDEGSTCAVDTFVGGVYGAGAKDMDSCRVEGGGVVS